MKLLLVLVFFIVCTGLAIALAPSSQIETQVRINASTSEVWAVLTDKDSFPEWNPLITRSSGGWAVGETTTNQMQFLDGSTPVFEPLMTAVEPERELRWLGRLWLPGIADGEHFFVLKEDGESTLLTHGERFEGIATWFFSADMFVKDFERFNEALRARVESRQR